MYISSLKRFLMKKLQVLDLSGSEIKYLSFIYDFHSLTQLNLLGSGLVDASNLKVCT